jgi:cytoskeletal protein CcmA (bactofilin family)
MNLFTSRAHRARGAVALLGVAAVAAIAIPLRGVLATVATADVYIITADEVKDEDLYIAASRAKVEGTVNGDLAIITEDLEISGTVTGDVLVVSSGEVSVSGTVEGSLRGAARDMAVSGMVGGDIAVAAFTTRISGDVGRDTLVFAGSFRFEGDVGRDIKGRFVSGTVDGTVGHDIDIAVGQLDLGRSTEVRGDLVYRSHNDAGVAPTAEVGGQFVRLPTRGLFFVELILTVATILGFFAFLLSGIVLLWVFHSTAPRAAAAVLTHPWRSFLVGVTTVLLIPLAAGLFAVSLVGIPLSLALLLLLALGLIFGPIPAVTALGDRMMRGRGGIYGAFLAGGVVWRLGIWLIPLVGLGLYLSALILGVGGWVVAAWEQRRRQPALLLSPRGESARSPVTPSGTDDWEAPLPPSMAGPEIEGANGDSGGSDDRNWES